MGSSEIVREISHKNYQVRQLGGSFILGWGSLEGYSVQLLGQGYTITEQYSRVENGSEKLDTCSLNAVSNIEYCKVCYRTWITKYYRCDELGYHEINAYEYSSYYPYYGKEEIYESDSHVLDMVKLQRSDIEKALTEIWQARGSKD